MAKKERKLGLPSTSAPPSDAPPWAVKPNTAAEHSDPENDPESEFLFCDWDRAYIRLSMGNNHTCHICSNISPSRYFLLGFRDLASK